jgi:hypothetical protein
MVTAGQGYSARAGDLTGPTPTVTALVSKNTTSRGGLQNVRAVVRTAMKPRARRPGRFVASVTFGLQTWPALCCR